MKIAVDFDGTLVKWPMEMPSVFDPDLKFDPSAVGETVELMANRVKEWLKQGHEVVIFTARVYDPKQAEIAREAISKWCLDTLGQVLEVTCIKSHDIDVIYDDKAVTVEKDTGRILTMGWKEQDDGSDSLGSQL